jgi:PmbA protein
MSDRDLFPILDLAGDLVTRALRAGADVAEAVVREGSELSARVRLGEVELLEQASHRNAGLRVIQAQRVALTSTSDLTPAGLDRFVRDAFELARLSQPDPFAGPAAPELVSLEAGVQLDLDDPAVAEVGAREAVEAAREAEAAARAFDPRVTNMQTSAFGRVTGAHALVLSGGFRAARRASRVSLHAVAVADDVAGKKRRGVWYETRRHRADLPSPSEVGGEAARRAVGMLGARKIATCEAPVVFSQEAASSLLGLFAGCVLGSAVWRKASYLVGREGERVASERVTIVDDPLVARGLGSRPHDGEGLVSRPNVVVERGLLRGYLCDAYAARKLGREPTASASRGPSGGVAPATSNFLLLPGDDGSEADIIADTPRGLYVQEMMGFGFNPTTGDFSRGASGYWIEAGKLAHPVSEVTISLGFDELLRRVDAVCGRRVLRSALVAPALRVSSMTIAGA